MIMNRLTMLAVTLMASMACFAQGNAKMITTLINQPHNEGDIVDLYELRYYITEDNGGNCLELEVIGFASDVTGTVGAVYTTTPGDPNKVTSEYDGILEIPSTYPASEVGVKCNVTSIAANAFTATTCRGDDEKYKAKFADAAALVTKIRIAYDEEFPYAITIGDNAFGSFTCVKQSNGTLTGLTEVENQTPGDKVAAISASSFATSVYKSATLKTPEKVMGKYTSKEGWKRFLKITDGSILLGDIDGNGSINALDVAKFNKAYKTGVWTGLNKDAVDMNSDGTIAAVEYAQFCKRYKEFY